jgi:hypothetical protein
VWEILRQRRVLGKVASRMMNAAVQKALMTWHEMVVERSRMALQLTKAVARSQLGVLCLP